MAIFTILWYHGNRKSADLLKRQEEIGVKLVRKYRDRLLQYSINLLLLLIFWGGMLRKSFNCDTLSHMLAEDADVVHRIEGGRYFAALVDYILFQLGLRTTTNLSITMLIVFMILAMAMLEIQDIFSGFMPEKPWAKAGFFCGINLVFLNVLFAEPLMFSEYSLYYAIAYLTAAAGVKCFIRRKYMFMLALYAIAVSFYQNAVVFATVLTVFFICFDEEMIFSRRAVVREITGIAVCMGMGVLNLLSQRILQSLNIVTSYGMDAEMGDLGVKLPEAVHHFINLNKSCSGIMPSAWFPLLFISAIWILIIYSSIKEHKLSKLPFLFIVWIGSNILLYIIPMMEHNFYFPPRLSFCFFLIQGLMLASAYSICLDSLQTIITMGGIMFLMLHLLFADFTVTNHFVSNMLDKVYINMVYEEIVKYENEAGILVTKLAVVRDADAPFSYEGISYVSDQINERALGTVPNTLIRVVSGKEFEAIEMPQSIYEQYFKDKNWDYFDLEEQLVIEGNTAYWCVF